MFFLFFKTESLSLIKTINTIGPRFEPCGTPNQEMEVIVRNILGIINQVKLEIYIVKPCDSFCEMLFKNAVGF